MAALDTRIDELYQLPLSEFTSARNALAKTLSGDDAKRVKALAKPVVVPWAINQLYWHARPVYERLTRSGHKLRSVQIAALGGKAADLSSATAAHRDAIRDAVAEATRLAGEHGANPSADALGRMLEAISVAEKTAEEPGRFTELLQPAGFEALAGVSITPGLRPPIPFTPRAKPVEKMSPAERQRHEREQAAAERERAAKERAKKEAIERAEAAVAKAKSAEAAAREEWHRMKDQLNAAEDALAEVKKR